MTHRTLAGVALERPFRLVPALLLALAGCQSAPRPAETASEPPPVPSAGPLAVVLDGDTAEWPAEVSACADEHYLYLRFTVEDEQFTLQGAGRTVSLQIDADGSASTGFVDASVPLNTLGVDLEVQFSPTKAGGGTERGVAVFTRDAAGHRQRLRRGAFEVNAAPTYAATWYEVRISRTPGSVGDLPEAGLLSQGTVSGIMTVLDGQGRVEAYADPFTIQAPPAAAGRRVTDAPPPARPAGAVRVMSWNVEKSSPVSAPASFRRVLGALSPDVVLVQEWEIGDAASVAKWFEPLGGEWHVAKAPGDLAGGGGVAIISRFPVSTLPAGLTASDENGAHAVRFVGAIARTEAGELVIGSVHLKCCGTKDSPEDKRRMSEARAINAMMAATAAAYPGAIRLVGGDLNLVGSRPPLDLLRAGLDADGSDLTVASPRVWGDASLTTWRDDATEFPPGRLDYLSYSDANADVVNAFVFDASRLSESVLAGLGLEAGDTSGSDHLPLVIDLAPVKK
jgi:exonuclease III